MVRAGATHTMCGRDVTIEQLTSLRRGDGGRDVTVHTPVYISTVSFLELRPLEKCTLSLVPYGRQPARGLGCLKNETFWPCKVPIKIKVLGDKNKPTKFGRPPFFLRCVVRCV